MYEIQNFLHELFRINSNINDATYEMRLINITLFGEIFARRKFRDFREFCQFREIKSGRNICQWSNREIKSTQNFSKM